MGCDVWRNVLDRWVWIDNFYGCVGVGGGIFRVGGVGGHFFRVHGNEWR